MLKKVENAQKAAKALANATTSIASAIGDITTIPPKRQGRAPLSNEIKAARAETKKLESAQKKMNKMDREQKKIDKKNRITNCARRKKTKY